MQADTAQQDGPTRRSAWTVKLYGLAFSGSVVLCLALKPAHGFSLAALVAACGATGAIVRLFGGVPVPLIFSVCLTAIALLVDPLGVRLMASDRPAAAIVQETGAWSECLMLVMSGRLIAVATGEAYDLRWRTALRGPAATSEQSVAAASLIGLAITLAILTTIPVHTGVTNALSVVGLLWSALNAATSIHVAILVAASTALVLIASGFGRYARECWSFARLRSAAKRAATINPDWIEAQVKAAPASTTVIGFAALLSPRRENSLSEDLRIEAAWLFHDASRQFLRRLLGLLPLLGFLGTVVGLAVAISGLPRGLSGTVDLTASLGGLAIKFETTFLGLTVYLVGSLLTNLLDRLELEARAGVMQLAAEVRHAPA